MILFICNNSVPLLLISAKPYISRAGKLVLNTFRSAVNILVLLISICIINTKLIAPIIVIYIVGAIVIKKIWNKISNIEKGIEQACQYYQGLLLMDQAISIHT